MKKLYIKEVPGKGRGMFCEEDIKEGELVEKSPVIIFPTTQEHNISTKNQYFDKKDKIMVREITQKKILPLPDEIANIIFSWSVFFDEEEQKYSCVVLGYGSIFNSDNPSNLRYCADKETKSMLFYATRDIPAHTELTINYSGIKGSHISDDNYWFTNKEFIK